MQKEYICTYLCKYAANGLDTLEKCNECPVKQEEDKKRQQLEQAIEHAELRVMESPDKTIAECLRDIKRELREVNRNLRGLKK